MSAASSQATNFGGKRPIIDAKDAVFLLIDHQSGLCQCVQDITVPSLRTNVSTMAKIASMAKVPVITTASVPQGPNGPLIPEIEQGAPHAQYVARRGEINAWDNPDFVAAVEATGRKTLVIAGVLTSVCVALPAISAAAAGYKVFAVIDASGDYSKDARDVTIARLAQAGVVPCGIAAVAAEVQGTWAREDAMAWAGVYAAAFPSYLLAIESYMKAQEVAKSNEQLDSQRK